ncbi:unnamed protein product, partial [Schistosoma curassoni]|uniref:Uncharacterized protein n=1 Tax=Schistosoma curassoni TaxID=6186 RepID=A0A183KE16_9TREM
ATNATPHISSITYRRNTSYQPSQAPCNQNISTFAATKEFKWLRRNKPLKFFGHRFSLETQPNPSPPTTPAPPVPQTAPPPPPSESYLFPFITPKKSMSTMNNCSSTVHSKSNLSGNNNLSGSLCFETQQLPVAVKLKATNSCSGSKGMTTLRCFRQLEIDDGLEMYPGCAFRPASDSSAECTCAPKVTRYQSSVRNMTGFSLFVNNNSNNTLKSVFFNHHNDTKTTTTTSTIVSSFRHQ